MCCWGSNFGGYERRVRWEMGMELNWRGGKLGDYFCFGGLTEVHSRIGDMTWLDFPSDARCRNGDVEEPSNTSEV